MTRRVALIGTRSSFRNLHFMAGCERHGYATELWGETTAPAADFEFAVCSGQHARTAHARQAFANAGKPVVILDLGYLRRSSAAGDPSGYNQAGWNRIGWVPEHPMPGDRFHELNLPLTEEHVPAGKPYLLVGGQLGGDAQHGMSAKALAAWLGRKVLETHGKRPALPVVYRPHPKDPKPACGWAFPHRRQDPRAVAFGQALAGCRSLLTFNSTLGVDAMLRGVPVISSPTAHYYGHAVADSDIRLAYLRRLAYAQWNLKEFSCGAALDFLLQYLPPS